MKRIFRRNIAGSLFCPLGERALLDIIRELLAGAHLVRYPLGFIRFPKEYRRNKRSSVLGASAFCLVRISVVVLLILFLFVLICEFLVNCSTIRERVSHRELVCVSVKFWKVFLWVLLGQLHIRYETTP